LVDLVKIPFFEPFQPYTQKYEDWTVAGERKPIKINYSKFLSIPDGYIWGVFD